MIKSHDDTTVEYDILEATSSSTEGKSETLTLIYPLVVHDQDDGRTDEKIPKSFFSRDTLSY